MHPAIRAFPSAYFYKGALIDADSVLERPEPWFRPTGAGGGGNGGGAGGSMQQQPPQLLVTAVGPAAGPSKRSRSPDPALAAAAAAAALAGGGGGGGGRRSSNDGGGGSSVPPDAAATLLLPYGVYDVAGGREHTVGRSKANSAEARLAVELYEALRPALLSREAQAAAEAAARNQGFLPLPPEVCEAVWVLCGVKLCSLLTPSPLSG
jgi:superfamily I DNA and/or RNA helicase